MNILLWLLQLLLALAFVAHGWLFLFPPPEIAEQMNASLPRWFQLFLGVAEILAGIGHKSQALHGSSTACKHVRRAARTGGLARRGPSSTGLDPHE